MRLLAPIVLLVAFARPVRAEPQTTVMVEPLMLVIGMVDSTIEVEPTHHVGLAAIAGYGKPMLGASLYDIGAQGNYYLQRNFAGFHLGGELRMLWGDFSLPFVTDSSSMSTSRERIVGAYAGYKWIASYGLSAVLQLGVGHIDVRGPDPMSKVIPVANLNAGWSF
jgi:hypothetical protein